MAAVSVRCAVVPGSNVIGIELPNKTRQIVYMEELISSRIYESGIGETAAYSRQGYQRPADLGRSRAHAAFAGRRHDGLRQISGGQHDDISLLFRLPPEKCRFIMIDPKMLELSVYDDIPHLLSPVVTEPGKAVVALKWTVREMEDRYRAMSKLGVRNIEGYNERLAEAAQKGRDDHAQSADRLRPRDRPADFRRAAAGFDGAALYRRYRRRIRRFDVGGGQGCRKRDPAPGADGARGRHSLIMATQRPSVDVITGVIKANFPTRFHFQVTSKIDLRTILGESGAEQLLGMGDMLYMAPGGRVTRVHGPFVSDGDVENVIEFPESQGRARPISTIRPTATTSATARPMSAMLRRGRRRRGSRRPL